MSLEEEQGFTVLDNLTLIGILVIALWVGAFAYYVYTSRQQREIREELDRLRKMLEREEEKGEA